MNIFSKKNFLDTPKSTLCIEYEVWFRGELFRYQQDVRTFKDIAKLLNAEELDDDIVNMVIYINPHKYKVSDLERLSIDLSIHVFEWCRLKPEDIGIDYMSNAYAESTGRCGND